MTRSLPVLLVLAAGCSGRTGSIPGLPQGTWTLTGREVSGLLHHGPDEVRLSLRGEWWGTDGVVRGRPATDEDGATWLDYPVVTAAGRGLGTLHLDVTHRRSLLPLGARSGELEVLLLLEPGTPDPTTEAAADAAWQARMATAQEAWRRGEFRIVDGHGALVGAIALAPGGQDRVEFMDPGLWTPEPVPAARQDEGPDVVLAFPVEPSTRGEDGLLRFNVPTLQAVLPVDPQPAPEDRWFQVLPGFAGEEEREARRAAARRESIERERAFLGHFAPVLAAEASRWRRDSTTGACPALADLEGAWSLVLAEYDVRFRETERGCQVELQPQRIQHAHRCTATATESGLGEVRVLE